MSQDELERLRQENDNLRRRLDEVERATFAETRPDLAFLMNREGVFLDYFARTPSSLYDPSGNFVGKNIREVLPTVISEPCVAGIAKALDTMQIATMDFELQIGEEMRLFESIIMPFESGTVMLHTRDITLARQRDLAIQRDQGLLHTIMTNLPVVVFAMDRQGKLTLSEGRGLRGMGQEPGQGVGANIFDLSQGEPEVAACFRRVLEEGRDETFPSTSQDRSYENWCSPMRTADGTVIGAVCVSLDVSERKQAAEEQAKLQREMLRVQEEALRELSTPLIPIADEVVIMPLIGKLDQHRASQVMEVLLHGVSRERARVAILDITGVPEMNEEVAAALMAAARAVELLGAEIVLTGIQSRIAQILVELEINLQRVVTRGTLKEGIQYALAQTRGGTRGGSRQRRSA